MVSHHEVSLNWRRTCFKLILVTALLGCFGWQVKDSIIKFLKRQKTLAMTSETLDKAQLPVFSFCPGFKKGRTPDDSDLYQYLEGEGSRSEDDIDAWLKNQTYNVEEVLSWIDSPVSPSGGYETAYLDGTGHIPSIDTDVLEVSTDFGRCYTVDIGWDMKYKDYFGFNFALAPSDEGLVIYVHEKYDEVGLHYGFWPIKPAAFRIFPRDVFTVVIKKSYHIYKHNDKDFNCKEEQDYSYPKCVYEWARSRFASLWNETSPGCWYPGLSHITRGLGLPPCANQEQETEARNAAYFQVISYLDDQEVTGCVLPCRHAIFKAELLRQPQVYFSGNLGGTMYVYMSTTLETAEEYLLFDGNAIVSAVGGSLGLFLGFSCLSTLLLLWQKATAFCKV